MFKAIFWDFGGVFTTSPFDAFNRYEQEHGLPKDFIRGVNATNPDNNAWARLENSEIDVAKFDQLFAQEAENLGHRVSGTDVLNLLAGDLRPRMIDALKKIRAHYAVACLTNNIKGAGKGPGMATDPQKAAQIDELMQLFDFVLESSAVGARKPETRFYEIALEQAGVEAADTLFLDDLGINLKSARAMGMTTIKVVSEEQALTELSSLLSMDLS